MLTENMERLLDWVGWVCEWDVTNRKAKLVPNLIKALHLPFHLPLALLPEAEFVRLFEAHGRGFLERTHAAVADACVCGGYVFDQVLRADEPAYAPACGVEVFAGGADC